ncbi:ISAs1 family transposase [Pseudomonadota bacterium]
MGVTQQCGINDKSNEITAIPKLLSQLDIARTVITIDAMGCQKKIAQQIIRRGSDYVLSLKGYQGNSHNDVITYFGSSLSPISHIETVNGGHGRIETQTLRATDDIARLTERNDWPGLRSILAVTANREMGNNNTEETRYFLSSLTTDSPDRLERAIRIHWPIENNLLWVLDIAINEDRNRTRKGHSAANLALVRHIALNWIKREKISKVGVKTKRLKTGRDNNQ